VNTYLLEWNPEYYPWDKVKAGMEESRQSGSAAIRWDVGDNKNHRPGDRAFMMRVQSSHGIIGAGWITSLPEVGPHWRQDKAGDTYTFVMVVFDHLVAQPLITLDELNHPPFTGYWWTPPQSGRLIPEPFATVLENRWSEVAGEALAAYQGSCAVTGCDVVEALEAAHIVPYLGPQTNCMTNGLLLRADIHTLFDLGLFSVNPTDYLVLISKRLKGSPYQKLAGQQIRFPVDIASRPSSQALKARLAEFRRKEVARSEAIDKQACEKPQSAS